MKLLITGGAGYLGQVLVPLFAKKHQIIVIDNLLYGQTKPEFPFIKADIANLGNLLDYFDNIDAVIHLAAIVGDDACKLKPKQAIAVNRQATKSLCEICKKKKIKKLIFASTCSVYGYSKKELTEKSKTNPLSLYAQSKFDAEKIIKRHKKHFDIFILRFGTLFGYSPRMRFDLAANIMTAEAVNKGKIKVYGGSQFRPMLYIKDAAKTIIKCLESDKTGFNLYNVGGVNYRIQDIAHKIFQLTKAKIKFLPIIDKRDYFVSSAKIQEELKIKFQSLDFGLKEILNCQENKDYKNDKYYNVKILSKL